MNSKLRLIDWKELVISNRNSMLLGLLLIAYGILSNCAHRAGPNVTGCVVNSDENNLFCTRDNKDFSIPLSEASQMICFAPTELEKFLKSCKRGDKMRVTECRYNEASGFRCMDALSHEYPLTTVQADNYFCVSERDKQRILERCK